MGAVAAGRSRLTQCSVDLIHDIEWRRLVVVQSEDQGKGRQCFLPSTEVCNVLPALLGGSNAENNTLHGNMI